MTLIDRYILVRLLTNFAVLFMLLFFFAVSIDVVLALDRFVDAARLEVGEEAGPLRVTAAFVRLTVNFQSPRFFQFYAYLHGLVIVGAMGFTLAQMHRHREIIAVLAAGLSMHRIVMPFVVATFGLSVVQLVNQEVFLPRVAPLLIRDHGNIGQPSVDEFPIPFTPDGAGSLFQAPKFDPPTGTIDGLTILERDDRGRTRRRITADRAQWTSGDDGEGWILLGGTVVTLNEGQGAAGAPASSPQPIEFYRTDLSPRLLVMQRYGQFATMLSLHQIGQMLATPGITGRDSLRRFRLSRFAAVLVNVLVMWLSLPAFLLRGPGNLVLRSVACATVAIPALLGAAVFMLMDLPGISPAVGVFLPAVILIPVVLAQWTFVQT